MLEGSLPILSINLRASSLTGEGVGGGGLGVWGFLTYAVYKLEGLITSGGGFFWALVSRLSTGQH